MKRINAAILLLAVILRASKIWAAPLWYDENFSLLLSRLPIARLLSATAGDVHPPLHYLSIWPIGQLITDPLTQGWLIRLPSLIFSVAAVWLFMRILDEFLLPDAVKAFALLLMAVAPIQIYYAQEGRMYALLEMLVLLSFLLMVRRSWVLLALSMTAMLYTQNYGLFYFACILAAGLIMRISIKSLLALSGAVFVLWLPWAGVMIWQMALINGTHWIPSVTPGGTLYALLNLLFVQTDYPGITALNVAIFAGWLSFAGFWIWQRRKQLTGDRLTNAAMLLAFGPLAMAVVVSLIYQPILLFRPLIGCAPFLYLLMVLPLATMQIRSRYLACGFIVPALIINLVGMYWTGDARKADDSLLPVLETIEAGWLPGDIVYHLSDSSMIDMLPYQDESTGQHYQYPGCGVMLGQLTDQTRDAIEYQIATLEDLDYSRAWIITAETPLNPPCEADYISTFTADLQPVTCFQDTEYVHACLYLVNK
jgi:uncharacterized membrane protein